MVFFMHKSKPIGIFDSGVGGLTVWKELVKELPNENVIYYADSANCPYGPRSKQEIIQLSSRVVDFLVSKNCKAVIVACNTATAAAIDFLRSNYPIPFIGMEPAVKPAALNTKTKSIAVLATEGTFSGKLYLETSRKYAKDVELNVKVGDRLVEIVENGQVNEVETLEYLKSLVQPLIEQEVDQLVLGCTHYPFLIDQLSKILPSNVKIIDPAPAIIKQTNRILEKFGLTNSNDAAAAYQFYSSGNSNILQKLLKNITDKDFDIKEI